MIVLKCDKCGTIFDAPEQAHYFMKRGDIWPGTIVMEISANSKMALRADLCEACQREVTVFFMAKKETAS